jgi:DNA-binding GntR family transcriptional regulator
VSLDLKTGRPRSGTAAAGLPVVSGTGRGPAVLAALRGAILGGTIAPGQFLREVDLSRQMAVSRSLVREAIRQLQQEGLVDFYPRQGAIVAGVPAREVEMIYGLRATIEAEAFATACFLATEEDLDRLTDIWYGMHTAMRRRDLKATMEADFAFHQFVVELVSSPFVRSICASLDGVVRATVLRQYADDDIEYLAIVERDVESHLPLLDALRSRDAERARRLALEHVDVPQPLRGLSAEGPPDAAESALATAALG